MRPGRVRVPRPTGLLVLFALVGLGALATLLSLREESQSVRLVDERAADLAASQLRGALSATVGSLRGADSLAADGRVDDAEFEAYADDIMKDSLFQAIAYVEVVPEDDRASFETRTGITLKDTDGKGGFVPAKVRSRALVVSKLAPINDTNRSVLGFDIASDPVRLAAAESAERTGLPALSDLISTATLATPGVTIITAVDGPGPTLGFMSSGLDLSVVVQRAGIDVPSFEDFGLRMDGRQLVGTSAHGATQTFDLAGRRFAVTVRTGRGFNGLVPIVIGMGTVVLLAAVVAASRRDRRQRYQIAVSARRSRAINELGKALALATDVRTVIAAVLERANAIMDADHVGLALRNADRPALLELHHDPSVPSEMARSLTNTEVTAARPFSECVRTGASVVLADRASIDRRFPLASGDAQAIDIGSLMWLPLTFGTDLCVGAVGFTWSSPLSPSDVGERTEAATTVAELTSRSLERAITSMVVQSAADHLGELARGLAAAHDAADVCAAVEAHTSKVLGSKTAELIVGQSAESSDPTTVERSIGDRDGAVIARLVLCWPRPTLLGPAQSSVFETMVEMIGQTLERTALTQQEHQVIVQLQRDLLRPPPEFPHLDIAVRYEPAMSVVGLGGDFYDVIPTDDDRVFVVIGDVTGHGSEAVAAMAELKAVMQSLLRGGRDLETVCLEADLLLDRRHMYATAQIAEVNPPAREMKLVNAGHPYPLLRRKDGTVEMLTDGHRSLLGLTDPLAARARSATWRIHPGDALLLYTDGLIERRNQSIDRGMQTLADIVRHHGEKATAASLVDHVVESSKGNGNGDKTDDDMALLVVRMLG